jgi:pimeloyl-ACP methyl ester carboxylesterase
MIRIARLPTLEDVLPQGIRSRMIENSNGLAMHVLEAGFETQGRPVVLLLHGFPELAFSWRHVMVPLAAAGFHVIAPDQRGYGRTTGWDARYDGDVRSFRPLNLVRDILGLIAALGIPSVAAIVGHDFGSMVAAYCALIRPDVLRSVVLMSAPFAGPPPLPFDTLKDQRKTPPPSLDINAALAALTPPRKHYHAYYASPDANDNMWHAPQGLHQFLRAYYHHKSADWRDNKPYPLQSWSAAELAKLPTYYVMNLRDGMAETVAPHMPSAAAIASCAWLTDDELHVYSAEYQRTGFQGGLNWYRCRFIDDVMTELQTFSGRTIDVPSCFIAGKSDWGIYQKPGDFEQMQNVACTRMQQCHLVDGAGHWVQQEKAEIVARLLIQFSLEQLRVA